MGRRIALALLLSGGLVSAQFSGRLAGTVVDSSHAPVAGASVTLTLSGGKNALLTTATANDGTFHFIGVRATEYDIAVAAPGFAKTTLRSLTVDPARETDIPTIELQLLSVTQSVDVVADVQKVETGSVEIADTISVEQVEKLPMLDRDPLGLLQTLPGVIYQGNSYTVINGLRTSYSNMTLDGINIQDNYIRDNALDYTPNRVLLGQIRQLTLVSSNSNSAAPGGATQLAFETPSGTNTLHGDLLWYNRNNAFAANDWFNNQAGVALPRLNQNQFGGSLAGPIIKDKLFFFVNYEGVRTNQQTPTETEILTDSARQGFFTYKTSAGVLEQVNLLALRNIQIDPYIQNLLKQVPDGSKINNYDVGDSSASLLRNTGGYRFNQRDDEVRDNITFRLDYNLSPRNVLNTSFAWNRDNSDYPVTDYSVIPQTTNPNHSHFLSSGWRWTPSANLTNELRGGFNLNSLDFPTSQQFGPYIVTGTLFTDPVSEGLPQGRATNTFALADNAAWQHGTHHVQFGTHFQAVRIRAYDDTGIIPSYNLAMGTGQTPLTKADLPGIRTADLNAANDLLATLGAYVDSYSELYNVTSPTSGYVNGAGNVKNLRQSQLDFYVQDNWKILPHLSATVGLRWDLPGVVNEANSLELLPEIVNNNAAQTLLSNATLNFAGASVGRPWYNRDWRDFAPNVGLAWDVFGDGKTSFRAGYSINYVNDQAILAAQDIAELNTGLVGVATGVGLSGQISNNLPAIVPPTYRVPVTDAQNYATNPQNTVGLINPDLRTPYVQQWSVGIQREMWHTVFEVRYLGNHGVAEYRAFDYNQVIIKQNGFLTDFLNAQSNGLLALQHTGTFNPAYNPSIAGSQQLPVFAQLTNGGQLNSSAIRNYIQSGEVGQLAANYQETGTNGSVNFFPNPNALETDMLNNFSNSTYNALQVVVQHRSHLGLDFSGSYAFSKVLSDTAGDSQSRIEQFLDVYNPGIERSRANFDLRHSIKANAIYDFPMGKGHRLSYGPLNKLLGGWSTGLVMSWQSGAPFSILSGLGTLNRSNSTQNYTDPGSNSYYNTADTALTGAQLNNIVKFQMTGNGPYMIAPSAINSDGTGAVLGVGEAAFPGEVFFNPGAGTLGTLQRRMFSGPWSFDLDASVQKRVYFTDRQSLELRVEGVNVLNHPTFWSGDQNINTPPFGLVGSMLNSPRILQIGMKYQF